MGQGFLGCFCNKDLKCITLGINHLPQEFFYRKLQWMVYTTDPWELQNTVVEMGNESLGGLLYTEPGPYALGSYSHITRF